MNISQIRTLNPNIANDHISMPYPHIELLEPSDAVALVLESLEKGDLPVICTYDNTVRKIASITRSALDILTLSRVSKLVFHRNPTDAVQLDSGKTIVEVLS